MSAPQVQPADAAVIETHLPLPGRRQGKVRDVYRLPDEPGRSPRLLVVASDRISAFDVVMPTPIVGKGRLLTELSLKWFGFIESRRLARTHLISDDPAQVPGLRAQEVEMLRGRSMIVRACRVVPIECVARGYLDGSGWEEYRATGRVCGVPLPKGLRRGDRLPEPIFTPATKEELGRHDENITFDRACEIVGRDTMVKLRTLTVSIYQAAHQYAASRGVLLADTKFEFGHALSPSGEPDPGELLLVDEALTPDSSRYWPADTWKPGGEQVSYDKQYLREYLKGLVAEGKWNKQAPGPTLPDDVVAGTARRYREVLARLFP